MDIVITNIDWTPGSKWECGEFHLNATSDLGPIHYVEVIPGPRHSPDSAEHMLKINGQEIDFDYCDSPDFGIPTSGDGTAAERFRTSMQSNVYNVLSSWLEKWRNMDDGG